LAIAGFRRQLGENNPLPSYGKRRARLHTGLAVLVLNLWELQKARERAAGLLGSDSPDGTAQHP
jgi:hypothetical protein